MFIKRLVSNKEKGQKAYKKGVRAEELAADFMSKKGYLLIERRYKTKYGEIDLIMRLDDLIAIIEVKSRRLASEALESITPRAQKRISNAALMYLAENPQYEQFTIRFDVIVVVDAFKIIHLDNAWQLST